MAIYSVSLKVFSRSKGHSATGACAYRLGLNITNEQTGERHDFSRRQDVVSSFTVRPAGSPEWEPERLWNEAEKAEKRKNSAVGRELLVALPHELSDDQRKALAVEITTGLVERYGVAASCGIHAPEGEGLNHHAHILFSTRRLTAEGFGEKTRELDDLAQGKAEVCHLREQVASVTNDHLARAGVAQRVDHRTLESQRLDAVERGEVLEAIALDRAPTKHEGRNPEVRARVEVENEATRQEARQRIEKAMAEIEARAEAEHRLMPSASDTPEARLAKERERLKAENGPRQAQEREALEEKIKIIQQEEAYQVGVVNKAVDEFNKHAEKSRRLYHEKEQREVEFSRKWSEESEAALSLRSWEGRHPRLKRLGELFPAFKSREWQALEDQHAEVSASLERRRGRLNEAEERLEQESAKFMPLRQAIDQERERLEEVRDAETTLYVARNTMRQNHQFENDPEAVKKIEAEKAKRLEAERKRWVQEQLLDQPFKPVEAPAQSPEAERLRGPRLSR